jgi:hypothetical protein
MNGKEQEITTFFLAFIGQEVIITTNCNTTVNFSDEAGNTVEIMPIFYEGILLDHDQEYLYLGENPNEINQAVKKSSVIHIMVKSNKDLYEEILDQMPNPGEGDVN